MKIIKSEPKKIKQKTDEDKRKQKGYELFSKHNFVYLDTNKYLKFSVRSDTNGGRYTVDLNERSCTCPDYSYRFVDCKHIFCAIFARHEAGYPFEFDFEPELEFDP